MEDVAEIMQTIIQVRSGLMTAGQAAKKLKISRQSYYKWENKALEGMCLALRPKAPGRPKKEVDQEKEKLQSQVDQLQTKLILAEQDIAIRTLLFGEIPAGVSSKKKP